jgi:GNAT superfamily N-acetyltransferase
MRVTSDDRVKIGPFHTADVRAAERLSTQEGWNKTAADWSRLVRLEPSGCFAARDGSRLVGTVTTTTYGRTTAWIGMMVIHPDFRRQGIGAALMRTAMAHLQSLGITSVKLDATPAGRPLYESLGFVAEAEMERWQGVSHAAAGEDARHPTDDGPRRLIELDRAAFGADRSRLLEALVAECLGEPVIMGSEDAQPVGYALARLGRSAAYVGPLVATTARTAEQLLDRMLARLAGEEVCLDLHRGGLLEQALLVKRGLSKRRGLTRMHHGPSDDAGTGRTICASAGPEFG